MKELDLRIERGEVYDEVAQTTSYTGAKMAEAGAYDRIFTTEEDRSQLERFWGESCVDVCETLKEFVEGERSDGTGFGVRLRVSSSFEDALVPAIRRELFSYFVMNITGKWYLFANKDESESYMRMAEGLLDGIRRKICHRRRPRRPARI